MSKKVILISLLLLSILTVEGQQDSRSQEYFNFEPNINVFKTGVVINGLVSYRFTHNTEPVRTLKSEIEKLRLELAQLQQINKLNQELDDIRREIQAQQSDQEVQQSQSLQQSQNTVILDDAAKISYPLYNIYELRIFGGTSFHSDFSEEDELKSFLLIPYTGTVFIGAGFSWTPKWFKGALKLNTDNYFSYFEGDVTIAQESQSIEQSYFHSRSGIEIIPIRKAGIDRFSIFLNVNIWRNGEYTSEDDTNANPLEAQKYFDFGFKLTGKLGERSTISLAPNFILTKDLNDHFDSNFIEVIRLYLKIPISK
ncbi:MAG: hypothetical protein AAF391_08020 [Bacteroidota bacterium]